MHRVQSVEHLAHAGGQRLIGQVLIGEQSVAAYWRDFVRDQYRPLVDDVSTREDLNTLMGEMIAELNVGHAYVQGGDLQAPPRSGASLLGATFEADSRAGRYRIAKIYDTF